MQFAGKFKWWRKLAFVIAGGDFRKRDNFRREKMSTGYERQLTIARYEKWISILTPIDRNLPVEIIGNRVFTPIELLNEIRNGTAVGEIMIQKEMEQINYFENL
jgi:hypothetical protein